ncbi:MAG TPA: autotransporter assembly complex family protein [Thermoanaerobaculia bacterium]|nr:autotransporter assembly complex family protein [Thermoanaerobaculia bacterium]
MLLLGILGAVLPAFPALAATPKVDVQVDGLSRELKRNVLASLEIQESRKDKDLDEARIRRLHAQAPAEIEQALQPYGHYKPVIHSTLDQKGETWVARYEVDAGPILKVTHRDLQIQGEGASDLGFQAAVDRFPLREGDPLFQPAYEGGKKAFDDYAAANGYLDGRFEVNEIRVDLATYTSEVALHYQTGPRYHFGPVVFHQDFLDPKLLRGYVTVKEGDPLDADELLKLQNALSSSPYFQRVEVVPRREGVTGVNLPIDVTLTPAKRHRYTAGVGYGTDTGPRVSGGIEFRRLNRRGHRGDVEARLSEIEKSGKADYIVPGIYPSTDLTTYTVAYADLHPQTSTSKSFLLGGSRARALGRWRQSIGLNFERTTFTVGTDSGVSRLFGPTVSWQRVFADDRIYPTHGERIEFDLRGADKSVLSNATFVQGIARAKFIQSFGGIGGGGGGANFGGKRFRLITRADFAYTETDDFHLLPPTVRLFAGGDQSVRGYSYQGIGPRDALGHVIGGKALEVASVELEYRFLQKWGVATFYDTGTANDKFGGQLKVGTGVGVRWLSPIGMIRLDFAEAIREPHHPIRIHLTIGPDL